MRTLSLIRTSVLVVAALMMTAGAARAAEPDSWITAKTKVALMTTEGIHTAHLNVDTVKGVVTLHGQVPTADQKTKAEDVAKKIDGVKTVKNLLQVVPSAERKTVDRSDDEIKKALDKAFDNHKVLKDSGIKVESVNNGVVLLSGKTKSHAAYVESVEVADAVAGVKRVSSEVVLEPAS
ncbi:MAG TPA: BON domain-containing protein [Vicinamibacterales bacterium]|jgi:hyperosmotically inducible protein|nr:BON domain-containing protein [Vicinamibacterales bacterium]